MQIIESRKEISVLVNAFYAKIREDKLLGPIFNQHIADDQWPAHLERLTDFWESNLLGVPKFRGNPPAAHIRVDKISGHTITQTHFGRWLNLWFETIDSHFEGSIADLAKQRARMMSTVQFLAMWNSRPSEMKNPS